ncbi:MAG: serine/threonine protein kinase [Myxococcales bacterium]|nr:serine/threonine protein kinase [Myxococcales bacterium]MCB9713852.1 serine/threonine protein kinase [Myxococcales bacterium]
MNDTTKPPRARANANVHVEVRRPFLRRYEPLAPCGSGGMGTVFRARDLEDGTPVAVKVIPRPDDWQRIQREIEALRCIDHPNVVRMLDCGFEDEQVVLVMEFVDGPTLSALLERERVVPWCSALEVAASVLEGLVRVHEVGLVHRDIKPSNLIVEDLRRGAVKILDFGIVKPLDENRRITEVGTVLGTPAYMPPEQLLGLRIGPSADVYAVGLVLLQMLTTLGPRTRDMHQLSTKMRLSFRLPRPEDGGPPEALLPLLRSMLNPMPERRPSSAAWCVQELRRILAEGDVPQIRRRHETTVKVASAP